MRFFVVLIMIVVIMDENINLNWIYNVVIVVVLREDIFFIDDIVVGLF